MKYTMRLNLRDKDGELLKTTQHKLDTERDFTCDIGIAIGPSERELMSRVEDISVTIWEETD